MSKKKENQRELLLGRAHDPKACRLVTGRSWTEKRFKVPYGHGSRCLACLEVQPETAPKHERVAPCRYCTAQVTPIAEASGEQF
jgi:hypothetical protein